MNERKDQNPSQTGQKGIDKDIEKRNRENETGQQQGQQFGQQGLSADTDTTLASQADQTPSEQRTTGLGSSEKAGGFVGTSKEDSSDYLTKEPTGEGQDFAEKGQGAQDTSAGKSDIETGKPTERDASLDDGSSNR